jgi:hypothetical protein
VSHPRHLGPAPRRVRPIRGAVRNHCPGYSQSTKIRNFAALPREVSLENLVPKDNFYRRLEATIDLSFVRDLVKDHYACAGRPSIDPVVSSSVCSW